MDVGHSDLAGGLVPLGVLPPGRLAEVVHVTQRTRQARRLHELGFHGGARVEVVRSGNPMIVRIGGCTLCVRHLDVAGILVRPQEDGRAAC